jgi:aspartate aminotransferase
VPLANKAKSKGIKVYHLNIGQPDLATPEIALEAMRNIDRKILEYGPSEGLPSFREKLTDYYRKFKIMVDVDDIIITSGGSEAVNFSFMACLDPGDEIIIPEPAYANYMAFAISCGAMIKTIPSSINDAFALPSFDKFEELITPKTKAVMICNPNNPTGYLYTQEEMNRLRDLVKKYDLFLFSDEVYREFCYTGAPYISAFHLEGIEQNVVLVDSVSKRYSECGLRVGALISKNKQVRENVMKWCQARLSPPLIGQIVAEASLGTSEEYMLAVYNEYLQRRNFLIDRLNRIQGCYSPIPMGAFYTVAKLPVDDADKFCAWCLSEFSYEGQTIMMAPASGFYTTPGYGKDEVRLAYVLNKEDLAKALTVLEKALESYPGRNYE